MNKKTTFIINPNSGTGRKLNSIRKTIDDLKTGENKIEVLETQYAGHASELVKKAKNNGTELIVVIGGDGTVNEVGKELIGTEISMGIIPTGSGNGIARDLGISTHTKKALDCILHGKEKSIDTGLVNDQHFIGLVGIGFDAFVAEEFNQKPIRGLFSYASVVTETWNKGVYYRKPE
ncbi:MAG: diacylglycerol kinase family protein [Flavobacteriales bacterium]